MRVVSMVLCEGANVMPDGRFNLLGGGIQRVLTGGFPAFVRFSLVVQILAERSEAAASETHRLAIRLIDDDGRDIMPRLASEVRFAPDRRDANILLDMNNLRFEAAGNYTFAVLVNGEERAVWGIEIRKGTASDAAPPAPPA